MKAVILADKRERSDTITEADGLSESFESIANRGLLLKSFDEKSSEFVPITPEIFLHWWLEGDKIKHQAIREHLLIFYIFRKILKR